MHDYHLFLGLRVHSMRLDHAPPSATFPHQFCRRTPLQGQPNVICICFSLTGVSGTLNQFSVDYLDQVTRISCWATTPGHYLNKPREELNQVAKHNSATSLFYLSNLECTCLYSLINVPTTRIFALSRCQDGGTRRLCFQYLALQFVNQSATWTRDSFHSFHL